MEEARMVVSDKGDILSPKYAPEIMAPAIQPSSKPWTSLFSCGVDRWPEYYKWTGRDLWIDTFLRRGMFSCPPK